MYLCTKNNRDMMKTKNLMTLMAIVAIALLTAMPAQARRHADNNGKEVIYTGDIAKKVIGYNGATPLNITIKDGKIKKIEALPNTEDPKYLRRATRKVFDQYEGLTVEEAIKLKPDVATGATYTSEALIKNIQMGLKQAKPAASKKSGTKKSGKKAAAKKRH